MNYTTYAKQTMIFTRYFPESLDLMRQAVMERKKHYQNIGAFSSQMACVGLDILLQICRKQSTLLELSLNDCELLVECLIAYQKKNTADNMIYVSCGMLIDNLIEGIEGLKQ